MITSINREKKLAQRLIKKYDLIPPIDIRELVGRYAKCTEDSLPNDADAICIMNIEEPLVILDRFKSETRKRFTLAHELGHLVIPWHTGMISCHTDNEDSIDATDYQKMESEANSFAAEILMPSHWLNGLISNSTSGQVSELIESVAEGAKVSRSAAFFSILKCLPSGYVFYIKNNTLGFDSFKFSMDTKVLIPTINHTYDFDWLDSTSIESATYEIDSIEIKWWRYPNSLTSERLFDIIEENNFDLNLIQESINNIKGTSFAASFKYLINLFPTGYVVDVEGMDYNRQFKSPNTNISIPSFDHIEEKNSWLTNHSFKSGCFVYQGYSFSWGYFVVEKPIANKTNDVRLSKNILKAILNDCYTEESIKKIITHKLNGIVGFLNGRAPDEFEEFYRLFKERLIGEEIYNGIKQHKDFEAFIINKINELLDRRAQR